MAMLLSPAGNYEMLKTAINNGAQSVYLGLEDFNARKKADNFTVENLPEVVDYCHLFGVKVYIAVNTSIKESELESAFALLDKIYESKADGVILADIALIYYCGKAFKGNFEIVASTQLNINNSYGARYVKNLGATTVVAARETCYADLEEIKKVGIDLECFVHGAMCVCQSGQCLFSSIVGGNSGNRGLCAQPCRRFYTAKDGDRTVASGYMLSPKDLCSLDNLDKLCEVADVLKIEGRNRRSQYSGEATRVYIERLNGGCDENHLRDLMTVYNRGNYMCEQYLTGNKNGIIYPNAQGHIGLFVGKIVSNKLQTSQNLQKGDAFKVLRDGIEVGNGIVLESGTGKVDISFTEKCRNGDSVHITSSQQQLNRIDSTLRKLDLNLCVKGQIGEFLSVTANCNGVEVTVMSDIECQQASNTSAISSNIAKQLSKTGGTSFNVSNIEFEIGDIYLPMSSLNALRRKLIEDVSCAIVDKYNSTLVREGIVSVDFAEKNANNDKPSAIVVCNSVGEANKVATNLTCDYLIVKLKQFNQKALDDLSLLGRKIFIDLPPFADLEFVKQLLSCYKCFGVVAHNVGTVQLALDMKIECIAGSGMNIFNSISGEVLSQGNAFIFSNELTVSEVIATNCNNGHVVISGDLTLMKFVHCPFIACGYNCTNCSGVNLSYNDKHGKYLIVRRRFGRCCFELVNGLPLSSGANKINYNKIAVQYSKNSLNTNYYDCDSNVNGSVLNEKYTKGRLFDKVN